MQRQVLATVSRSYVDVSRSGWVVIARSDELQVVDTTKIGLGHPSRASGSTGDTMTIYRHPNVWGLPLMKLVGESTGELVCGDEDYCPTVKLLLIGGYDVNAMNHRLMLQVRDGQLTVEHWLAEPNEIQIALDERGLITLSREGGNLVVFSTPLGQLRVHDRNPEEAYLHYRYVITSNGDVYDVMKRRPILSLGLDVEEGSVAITGQTLAALYMNDDADIRIINLETKEETARYRTSHMIEDVLGVIEGSNTAVLRINVEGMPGTYQVALQFNDVEQEGIIYLNDLVSRAWLHGRDITVLTAGNQLVRYTVS